MNVPATYTGPPPIQQEWTGHGCGDESPSWLLNATKVTRGLGKSVAEVREAGDVRERRERRELREVREVREVKDFLGSGRLGSSEGSLGS